MQQSARIPFWFLLANMTLLVAAFALGSLLGTRLGDLPEEEVLALKLVHRQALESHVDFHDPHELLTKAIQGMVSSLDKYSAYIPPARAEAFDEDTTGEYHGIGVILTPAAEDVTVRNPIPGGPAERAGLEVGDRILAIDGEPLGTYPPEQRQAEAVKRLKGRLGDHVVLTIGRQGEEPFDVRVDRGPVQKPSVKWTRWLDIDAGLGYLHVADFHNTTAAEFDQAVEELRDEGTLHGLVIDLRFNSGGLLEECLHLTNRFVASGTLVSTKRRGHLVVDTYTARPDLCSLPELPLVLLVNGRSASASEVMAGALQDHGRAVLVGTTTYGKGVVNTIYSWKDLDFRLKLTTAHYYTPKGRNIEKRHRRNGDEIEEGGITPDHEVAVDEELEQRLFHSLQVGYDVPAPYRKAVARLAQEMGFSLTDPISAADDPQLAAAIEVLRSRIQDH